MNRWKGFLIVALSLCISFGMTFCSETGVKAADTEQAGANGKYTYTVTLYSGEKGSFAGGDKIQFTGNEPGTMVSFDAASLVSLPENSKYYVKGIRRSGRDNNTALANSSFIVEEDADYVVAYGIKGEMVAYTVNYRDADGNELAPSRTYYGNVGDKPVIAYLYIEGYSPQAYNLTKTLVSNEAENVFNFEYSRETGANTQIIQQVPAAQETTGTGTDAATDADADGADAATGAGADAAAPAGDADAAATVTEPAAAAVPDEDVPQDLVDLDDDEVPLANTDVSNNALDVAKRLPLYGAIIAGTVALGGLIFLILWLKRYRHENAEDNE